MVAAASSTEGSPSPDDGQRARLLQARVFSIGMALSCASWVVLGLLKADPLDRWTAVRLGIACLHATTAVLFALRIPARQEGSVFESLAALPSLALSGLLFRFAPAPSAWPLWAQVVFIGGVAWTIWSLGTLGKSFAFLPARRDLVTKGPYAVVRHPAYLGELVMTTMFAVTGFLAADTSSRTLSIAAACIALLPTLVWRISVEDAVMQHDDRWKAYAARTRFRLLPGVF